MDDLLQEFIAETNENLSALDSDLLRLEKNPGDRDLIGRAFRLVHTVKGNCGFLNLPRLENVAHHAENVLGQYRSGAATATPDSVSLIFQSLDRIRSIVGALEQTGSEPAGDDAALITLLDLVAASAPQPSTIDVSVPPPEPATKSVRISLARVEEIMTVTGELVLTRNRLLQAQREDTPEDFKKPLERLDHAISALQDSVMAARMQDVGSAWSKLPRLVRDTAIDLGKKIRLETAGDDVVLDRQVLELIRDPLTHLVRNAADHGIETPATRAFAGKPVEGTIRLAARHEGGQVLIDISDDGRGIDIAQISRKALEKGLVAPEKLAAMTPQQLRRLIFLPGFSTAATVTAISGRGVGMDVVRENIESIGGAIDIASTLGSGTTITLRIPLTLAIVPALLLASGGACYALPQGAVMEIMRIMPGLLEEAAGAQALRWRGQDLPAVSLATLLKTANRAPPQIAIIVSGNGQHFALLADAAQAVEDIVVKPLAPVCRRTRLFSGNAVLGDGRVIFILDAAGLAQAAGLTQAAEEKHIEPAAPPPVKTAYLTFRQNAAGDMGAVPLLFVFRLEKIEAATIERAGGNPVLQYRGNLIPLLKMGASEKNRIDVVVLEDKGCRAAIAVENILDIVEEAGAVLQGQAIISGRAVDVMDAAALLQGVRA